MNLETRLLILTKYNINTTREYQLPFKGTRGNPPRLRITQDNPPVEGTAARGLPRNCYDIGWYNRLSRFQRQDLHVRDVDYDFSIDPVEP